MTENISLPKKKTIPPRAHSLNRKQHQSLMQKQAFNETTPSPIKEKLLSPEMIWR